MSTKSTEFQTNMSPRNVKTDDSKFETSTDKDRITELENEIQLLKDQNQRFIAENSSLRTILRDYEEMKTNENILLERLKSAAIKEQVYESKLNEISQQCIQLSQKLAKSQDEIQSLSKENKKIKVESEMNANHQETKIHLLKEALNKRNEDIKQIEETNDELIKLLQKWDEKLLKLDEEYKLEKDKNEKYEQQVMRKVSKLDSS